MEPFYKEWELPCGITFSVSNDYAVTPKGRLILWLLSGLFWLVGLMCEVSRVFAIAMALFALLILTGHTVKAASIPHAAEAHKRTLIRISHSVWGLDAPVAVFAAQIHQESRWNVNAKSPVGAVGLAQFMPATAKWMGDIDPELKNPAPRNPGWAFRGLVRYNLWLWNRAEAENDFERMAFVLSAYNGGEKWRNRDAALAKKRGLNPLIWFGHVETVNGGRSAGAFRENRSYPRLILKEHQGMYERAGWGPGLHEPTEANR